MALDILFKRGNTAQNDAFTGALGSITIDTQSRKIRVHDGVTQGGHVVANMSDISSLETIINSLEIADIIGLQTALDDLNTTKADVGDSYTKGETDTLLLDKVDTSSVGVSNGLATLDVNGKVPLTQINDSILGQVEYKGSWNASTNTPSLPSTPTEKGHYYIVTTAGTQFSISFEVGDWIISNGTIWEKVDNTDAVSSVNGKTGVVVIDKSDVGLGNVDNTSDINKPISTLQQSALNLKADIDSPALTGTPTAPTATPSTNTTQIATTEFVQSVVNSIDSGVTSVNGLTGAVTITAADLGIVKATQTETETAVDDTKYMTPLKTKQLIEAGNFTIDLGTF
jgi:hypothetical protein